MSNIVILGAGMAGCGAAYRLSQEGLRPSMYDQKPYFGGHTASFHHRAGFIFDDGPHVSFTKNERIQRLFAESVHQQFETIHTYVNNYWRGHWIKHPAQCNLYGLPVDLLEDVITDMVEAKLQPEPKIENYSDWLVAAYGRTFAETFPMEYGLKYHTTAAGNMTTDWLGPRLYRPELREVIHGALSPSTSDVHYVTHFRYPTTGGFGSYIAPFATYADVHLSCEVTAIDPSRRTVTFSDGSAVIYDELVSSIPLPVLVPMIAGVPSDVREAAGRLACSTCVLVNVGIARDDITTAHWTYFYDRDFSFTRLSFPHLLSRNTVPPGCGSIQAELYFSSKYRPLMQQPDEFIEPVIADLKRCGLLHENEAILFRNATLVPFANVIFDLDRPAALKSVHGYLDEVGILPCGRYGEWGYHWTDESFVSGENAAQRALDRITSRGVPA